MWAKEDLVAETEWSRSYAKQDGKLQYYESKFLNESVSICFETLVPRWGVWTEAERLDFCHAFTAAPPPDSEDIIRLIASCQSVAIRSMIAACVASRLPTEEAVSLLIHWADTAAPGPIANHLQALTITGHPCAHGVLQGHYSTLLAHPMLSEDAGWSNHVAEDLMWCVKHLIELGTHPSSLRAAYEVLIQHPCRSNRDQAERWLSRAFESATA